MAEWLAGGNGRRAVASSLRRRRRAQGGAQPRSAAIAAMCVLQCETKMRPCWLNDLSDVQDIETLREDRSWKVAFSTSKRSRSASTSAKNSFPLVPLSPTHPAATSFSASQRRTVSRIEFVGIEIADPDKERQRLLNVIRDGLEPRLSGLDTKWLPIEGLRGVMVVRTARSWSAPHRVTYLKDMNFYIRNPAGKHPMSVDELRRSFNLSASIAERMGDFRNERVRKIALEWPRQIPFELRPGPKIAVLIVPLSTMVDPLDLHIQVRAKTA